MALSKLTYNSLNVTAAANKGIGFDSGADDLSTDFAGGSMRFISKFTSDGSDATASITSGIDSTYKEYIFIFKNIHPEEDGDASLFTFNGSTDSGSNYNVTKTTTVFQAIHPENDAETSLGYQAGRDLAQSTAFQNIGVEMGADNDQNLGGYLHLFNPSSTTFVKHFTGSAQYNQASDYSYATHIGGYFNTTSAVDAIQFKFGTGEIQGGKIKLYGLSDS